MRKQIWIVLLLLFFTGCSSRAGEEETMLMETMQAETAAAETMPPATIQSVQLLEPPLLTPLVDPRDTDFVRVADYVPCLVELNYAASDNFTEQVIYEFEDVFLRYGTVMKLKAVAEELQQQGLGIKIWDGFRPVSAQFRLWEICPDETYVANPNKGYSNHSRGFAVDLTLVDRDGLALEMPTAFDDFSARADRDYSDCTEVQAANARLLQTVMEKHGFQGYWGEWWHFNDNVKYDVETCFDPAVIARRLTAADTPLLKQYWQKEAVLTIPAGEGITVLGYEEDYVLAEFWGYRGYIAQDDLQ